MTERCKFCGGCFKPDGSCIMCGRSNDYEYEATIAKFNERFEKGEVIIIPATKRRARHYPDTERITEEIWATLTTKEIAERLGCSDSRISRAKPKKFKRVYKTRNQGAIENDSR